MGKIEKESAKEVMRLLRRSTLVRAKGIHMALKRRLDRDEPERERKALWNAEEFDVHLIGC
jgi:hypothetical protein